MEDMARQVREFGKDHGLIHEAVVTGRKAGAGHAFWARLAHDEELFKKVVGLVSARPTFSVVVDYDLSFNGMIEAGKYDWVNQQDITAERFPVKGEGDNKFTIELFHFNRGMESDEMLSEMDRVGYRPAIIEELLALGAKYLEEQRKYPIVALGSVWQHPGGGRGVPYLWGSRGRFLSLFWLGSGWYADCRFAAVRK